MLSNRLSLFLINQLIKGWTRVAMQLGLATSACDSMPGIVMAIATTPSGLTGFRCFDDRLATSGLDSTPGYMYSMDNIVMAIAIYCLLST